MNEGNSKFKIADKHACKSNSVSAEFGYLKAGIAHRDRISLEGIDFGFYY